MNISELKEKVISGIDASQLSEDEIAECIHFCQKTWIAWKKSNGIAENKRKIVNVAMKNPDVRAFLATKGIVL